MGVRAPQLSRVYRRAELASFDSPLGPRAHLPLIELKISGPHGAGQYLRRALSAYFIDFDHYRCRVDFRLCLFAR